MLPTPRSCEQLEDELAVLDNTWRCMSLKAESILRTIQAEEHADEEPPGRTPPAARRCIVPPRVYPNHRQRPVRRASWDVPQSVAYKRVGDVRDLYHVVGCIGEGGFATVFKARSLRTTGEVAIKMIPRHVFARYRTSVEREVNVMAALNHPRLMGLREVVRTPDAVCLVTELMRGGDLFDYVAKLHKFSECKAQGIFAQVAAGVYEMHKAGVMHRDLKPENVLVEVLSQDVCTVKICDFGLARFHVKDDPITDGAGTAAYCAPEVFKAEPATPAVDVWSLGVILYVMLSGTAPFHGTTHHEIRESVLTSPIAYPPKFWERVSRQAKQLLRGLLRRDPAQRLTISQVLTHPWVVGKGNGPCSSLELAQEELRRFNATRKLRKAVFAALAQQRMAAVRQSEFRKEGRLGSN